MSTLPFPLQQTMVIIRQSEYGRIIQFMWKKEKRNKPRAGSKSIPWSACASPSARLERKSSVRHFAVSEGLLNVDIAIFRTTSPDERYISTNVNRDYHHHGTIQSCAVHLGCQLALPFQGEAARPATAYWSIPLTTYTGLHLLRFSPRFLATFQGSTRPDRASVDLHPRQSFHLDLSAAGCLSGNLSRPRRMDQRDVLGSRRRGSYRCLTL